MLGTENVGVRSKTDEYRAQSVVSRARNWTKNQWRRSEASVRDKLTIRIPQLIRSSASCRWNSIGNRTRTSKIRERCPSFLILYQLVYKFKRNRSGVAILWGALVQRWVWGPQLRGPKSRSSKSEGLAGSGSGRGVLQKGSEPLPTSYIGAWGNVVGSGTKPQLPQEFWSLFVVSVF